MSAGLIIVLHGGNLEFARQRFKEQLLQLNQKPEPVPTTVLGIFATPFMEQLLSEAGPAPIDWKAVNQQEMALLHETPDDDFEQGYWVNVDEAVNPDNRSPDIEALQNDLPEDVRSGLNWAPERQFFFLLTAFSLQPQPQPEEGDESDEDKTVSGFKPIIEPHITDDFEDEPPAGEQRVDDYPDELTKNVAGLIQARNSVVAAWLWRRYAATSPLAAFPSRIDPWCLTMGVDGPAPPGLSEPECGECA